LLESYKDQVQKAKAIVVIKPSKLTPNETNDFRKEIFDFGASLNIVKNTIFKIALKENKLPEISDLELGEHAVLFMGEDYINPSKALKKFAENTKTKAGDLKITIITGILDGQILSSEQVTELADMPSIQGSVSMILGILDQAMSSVVNVLEDPTRSYVTILDLAFKE